MSETEDGEIRQLEIAVAKVLGWEEIRQESRTDKHFQFRDEWYGRVNGRSSWELIPRFARDPVAVMEALTWLIKGDRLWMVCLQYDNGDRKPEGKGFFVIDHDCLSLNNPHYGPAETLGGAICKAIVAIGASGKTSEGEE